MSLIEFIMNLTVSLTSKYYFNNIYYFEHMYMLWFNFILGLNFICFHFKLIIMSWLYIAIPKNKRK